MRIQLKKRDYKTFNRCGIDWAQKESSNKYSIHKHWLNLAIKSGMVKKCTINEDKEATIEFVDYVLELFPSFTKTITNENNRGVEISFVSGLDMLHMQGYDGWGLDLGELEGEYLAEFVETMARVHKIKSKIKEVVGNVQV